ncbi:MAG: hypothetical protein QN131_11820 [Armatimonadota bacterium]|nr:hypothetical protein [Armatimonadota bacterium]MDR7550605.1 hypothetical protein [Armatimonadota bacterium]
MAQTLFTDAKNVLTNPTITIRVGRRRQTFTARPVRDAQRVQAVVQKFRARYTPGEIARYYTGLDAAVRIPQAG